MNTFDSKQAILDILNQVDLAATEDEVNIAAENKLKMTAQVQQALTEL